MALKVRLRLHQLTVTVADEDDNNFARYRCRPTEPRIIASPHFGRYTVNARNVALCLSVGLRTAELKKSLVDIYEI